MKRLLIVLTIFLIAACSNNSEEGTGGQGLLPKSPSLEKALEQKETGGLDSSGGDTIKSSKEQVLKQLESLHYEAGNALFRLGLEFHIYNAEQINFYYGDGSAQVIRKMFSTEKFDLTRVITAISKKEIKLNIKDEYCVAEGEEHKDGSATGFFPSGEICLSIKGMRTIPPESLKTQIVALYLHELSHLFGSNEKDAVDLQKILIKGKKYLVSDHSQKEELVDKMAQMAAFIKPKSDSIKCSEINHFVSISERLESIAGSSDENNLDRLLPIYMNLELQALSSMSKGLRGFCGQEPQSTNSSFNVMLGDKKDLSLKLIFLKKAVEKTVERVFVYINPLRNPKQMNKALKLFAQLSATKDPDLFEQVIRDFDGNEVPQSCVVNVELEDNQTFFRPLKGIVFRFSQVLYCSQATEGHFYRYYAIPVYWIPGSKIPWKMRKRIEGLFIAKISELKIRDRFKIVLSLLSSKVDKEIDARTAYILQRIGFIKELTAAEEQQASDEFIDIVVDVLLTYQAELENKYKSQVVTSLPLDIEIFIKYAMTQGRKLGILPKGMSEKNISLKIKNAIQQPGSYARRAEALRPHLKTLFQSLF